MKIDWNEGGREAGREKRERGKREGEIAQLNRYNGRTTFLYT